MCEVRRRVHHTRTHTCASHTHAHMRRRRSRYLRAIRAVRGQGRSVAMSLYIPHLTETATNKYVLVGIHQEVAVV